ncbi:MAG: hypothetical protein OXH52_01085 [Gammaproteobacteria bacterium]|nr:hypothetical protein [Gammaproteobacteria bacterium]
MAASSNADLDGIIFGSRSSSDQANVEILMEQYKLFVETSERLGLRTALCYHRAYARGLHLDHIRALVAENRCGHRPRVHRRHVNDADSRQ